MAGRGLSRDMSRLKIQSSAVVVDDSEVPMRPTHGTLGGEIQLEANYFPLMLPASLIIHRYDIKIDPPVKQTPTEAGGSNPRTSTRREPAAAPGGESASGDQPRPNGPTGKKFQQLVKTFLGLPGIRESRNCIFTDFKAVLFSKKRLPNMHEPVRYGAENNNAASPNALTYRVHLIWTKELDISNLTANLGKPDLKLVQAAKKDIIQVLNILLLHHGRSSSDCFSIGTRRSFPSNMLHSRGLKHGLTALRGYFSSVHVVDSNILVNVNVSHSTFYDPVNLLDLIQHFGGRLPTFYSLQQRRESLHAFLKGFRVELVHLKDSAHNQEMRPKRIVGLATDEDGVLEDEEKPPMYHAPIVHFAAKPKEVKFWLKNREGVENSTNRNGAPTDGNEGSYISVFDFFRNHHHIPVNEALPVVNVGSVKYPVHVPPELCKLVPGQIYKGKLSGDQTTEMMELTVMKNPQTKGSILGTGFKTAGLSKDSNHQLPGLGLQIAPQLTSVQARILSAPKLKYRDNKEFTPWDGKWNLRGRNFREGKNLPQWSFLHVVYEKDWWKRPSDAPPGPPPWNQQRDREFARILESVKNFRKVAKDSGIQLAEVNRPRGIVIQDANDAKLKEFLERFLKELKIDLLLVILPGKDAQLYNTIKRIGDVEVGLRTVCALRGNFCKDSPQYFANVTLKINLKMGGINHQLDEDSLSIIKGKKTMVVGIDVTHPSPGSRDNCPSIAAMVASINWKLGQWPAIFSLQRTEEKTQDANNSDAEKSAAKKENELEPGKEIVSDIGAMLESRLDVWKKHNASALPDNILIYRDGVSEGQYQHVLKHELEPMKQRCQEIYRGRDMPRFTLIVVTKRHHTRFFPVGAVNDQANGNPGNGTIVDRGVTDDRRWDFFLQSHMPIQGTARPAHYIVLKNEIFIPRVNCRNVADAVEAITHNLCYLYGRATRAVSYCPPAYYADRACERARCYLSRLFDLDTVVNDQSGAESRQVQIHPNLRDSMFYV